MSFAITPYTDTDKIRAALGVDSVDVDDQVLVDMQLGTELILDLNSWIPGYTTLTGFSADLLSLYAASFCALSAIHGRELLYPQMFKDGKAESRRFALDLEKVKDNIAIRLAGIKKALITEEGLTVAAETVSSFILGSAPPNYDPVTGA